MMDCNKEEAIRAKVLAEKKMLNKDFIGARKVALRAQQLYPELDNISQLLTVCDVHCSSEQRVLGSEMNWYAILQIEQTANEASIKKQYRKLALLLHPDKNKFAGAEAAFKLIGEAQRVLSDPAKRATFDMKHRASVRTSVRTAASRHPQQPHCRNTGVTKNPGVNSSFANSAVPMFTTMNPHQRQQQQQQQSEPVISNGRQTFWTICPFCNIRYQYYKDVMNRALRCQSCLKTFIAHDLDGQVIPPSSTQSQFSQERVILNQGGHKMGPQVNAGNSFSCMGVQGNAKMSEQSMKTDGASEVDRDCRSKRNENVRVSSGDRKDGPNFQTEKPNTSRKRSRKKEDSSESCDSGDSSESEDFETLDANGPTKVDSGLNGGCNPRRSSRQKQKVSYNEYFSDEDDFARPRAGPKGSGSSKVVKDQSADACGTSTNDTTHFPAAFGGLKKEKTAYPRENLPNGSDKTEEHKRNGKGAGVEDKEEGLEVGDSGLKTNADPEVVVTVPDPDFYDFDKDRKEECFAVNQIWALYDDKDGMPRFYARIRKVFSPGFKVRISWLEADPHETEQINWLEADLPSACGNYKNGEALVTEDLNMFSHLVCLAKVPKGNYYKIYPQKGEIWALFKNWHITWSSDPDNHRTYEYEFVVVLSDYFDTSGIAACSLVKIKGFVSLFRVKKGTLSFVIPPNELFRFSHRVPSYRTTGSEREGIPEGYFELDPASLPSNLDNTADSEDLKINLETVDTKVNGSCSKSANNESPSRPNKCTNAGKEDSRDGTSRSRRGSSRKLEGNQKKVSTCAVKEESNDHSVSNRGNASGSSKETNANSVTEDCIPPDSSMEPSEIPEAVFYDFGKDRTVDKFQPGQIWALFCELDGLPKYYARIHTIKQGLDIKLGINWLEHCQLTRGMIQWFDESMPICCGKFKIVDSVVDVDASSFSHLAKASPSGKGRYDIYPKKGEIWALYKNFNSEWTCSDLEKCEYDMVEVLEDHKWSVKVLVLARVDGHETIFSARREGESVVTLEIPRIELLRFSHKVPAFLLTDELEGMLRGCWELDPQSIPVSLFSWK